MLNVRGPGRATSPPLPALRGRCDEIATKATDVTLSSNRPRTPSVQRALRPEELSTGALLLGPDSLLAGPFFRYPQKRWPWRMLHGGLADAASVATIGLLSAFSVR